MVISPVAVSQPGKGHLNAGPGRRHAPCPTLESGGRARKRARIPPVFHLARTPKRDEWVGKRRREPGFYGPTLALRSCLTTSAGGRSEVSGEQRTERRVERWPS